MHRSVLFATSTLLAAASMPAQRAAAQEIANDIQLGLVTSVFSYSSGRFEDDDTGVEVETSNLTYGVGDNILLEGGYAINDMWVVGGLFSLAVSRETRENEMAGGEEEEAESFDLFIGPKVDLMLGTVGPQAQAVPFVGLIAGFTTRSTEISDIETSATGFEARLRGGLRWFPVDNISFDPQLALGWATASGEVEAGGETFDQSGTQLSLWLLLGVSGWLE